MISVFACDCTPDIKPNIPGCKQEVASKAQNFGPKQVVDSSQTSATVTNAHPIEGLISRQAGRYEDSEDIGQDQEAECDLNATTPTNASQNAAQRHSAEPDIKVIR